MFDSSVWLTGGSGSSCGDRGCRRALADEIIAANTAITHADCRVLLRVAEWVDLYAPTPEQEREAAAAEREPMSAAARLAGEGVRAPGGDGTPRVSEFCFAELGGMLGMARFAAEQLVADVVDLRHRLPLCWGRVQRGEVRSAVVRRVAAETRWLSMEAAALVDRAVAPVLGSVTMYRLRNLVDAEVLRADPAGYEARVRADWDQRVARVGQTNQYGLKTLFVRARAADVVWFDAMLDRIADILKLEGDPASKDVRRSKALGVLARPDHALLLLAKYASMSVPGGLTDEADPAADPAPADPADEDIRSEQSPTYRPEEPPTARPEAEDRARASQDERRAFDPATTAALASALGRIDPVKLLPPVTLYVHVAEEILVAGNGPVRDEHGGLTSWHRVLAGLAGTRVTIKPVIDPRGATPVDAYEVPRAMRERIHLRQPVDQFPWGTQTDRHRLDLDHTIAYTRHGPPGQTGLANLAPLSRTAHRIKTHGGWQLRQPEPGVMLWRSPLGQHYLINHTGTHPLGHGPLAHALWQATDPEPTSISEDRQM
ncbi:hypothetical protein [Microlunatus sp. Y2014]|uniref:hypothetical protein n=1 Tax=Microlunatus sp. Y2014 TaxID=3418488 RepID=UPI003DA6D526